MKIESDPKLDFNNVLIRPKRTTLTSRSSVDVEREIKFPHSTSTWKGVPIIAANMDTVGTLEVYQVLSKHKIITALHKFYDLDDLQELELNEDYFMISTGISDSDYDRLKNILDNIKVKWVCIDVANGYMQQLVDFCKKVRERYPDKIIACVGGGSNAMGIFYPFLKDNSVDLIGVEAGGSGVKSGKHAAPLSDGSVGVLHGMKTYLMQDDGGQILSTHSVSAGLDYPGVGPEHSYLRDSGRVVYESATDDEALDGFHDLTKTEGIMPALETAHALAFAKKIAPNLDKEEIIVVNLSGRGDKDMANVAKVEGLSL